MVKTQLLKQFEELGDLYQKAYQDTNQTNIQNLKYKLQEANLHNTKYNSWPRLLNDMHLHLNSLKTNPDDLQYTLDKYKEIAGKLQLQEIIVSDEMADITPCRYGHKCNKSHGFVHKYSFKHPRQKQYNNFAGALFEYLNNYRMPDIGKGITKSRKPRRIRRTRRTRTLRRPRSLRRDKRNKK